MEVLKDIIRGVIAEIEQICNRVIQNFFRRMVIRNRSLSDLLMDIVFHNESENLFEIKIKFS